MQKILLSLSLLLFVSGIQAQTIVSTDPQNNTPVLEYFSGIYCGFCPAGRAIAEDILADNPDMVLITYHSGGFANPQTAADLDFRTEFGQAIDDQTDLVGYPAGTVNRINFPERIPNSSGNLVIFFFLIPANSG